MVSARGDLGPLLLRREMTEPLHDPAEIVSQIGQGMGFLLGRVGGGVSCAGDRRRIPYRGGRTVENSRVSKALEEATWALNKAQNLQRETADPTVKELARTVAWLSDAVVSLSRALRNE